MQLTLHNGILDTEKIFKKIELMISMARFTPNLVNASQKSEKKVKKVLKMMGFEPLIFIKQWKNGSFH